MSRTIREDLKVTSTLRAQRNPGAQRLADARGQGSLEQEVLSEMASSMRRAEDKVLAALDTLEQAYAAVEAAAGIQTRHDAIARYNEAREVARVARWEMIVHREAIGLRDSRLVRDRYPIPKQLPLTP